MPRPAAAFSPLTMTKSITRSFFNSGSESITALRPGLTTLPSGLRAPTADIKLENGEQVLIPLINLEVVG